MSSILQALNLVAVPGGTSWERLYDIDAGSLTNASRTNFFVLPLQNDQARLAICFYLGTGALTTSEFNNLPQGSVIVAPNISTPTIYIKEGASTFNAIT